MVDDPHSDPFVCTGCHAYQHTQNPCPLCGSAVVPAELADELPPDPKLTFAPRRPRRLGAMLVVGLLALAAPLLWSAVIWLVWNTPLALAGTVACGSITVAMLLPWKQRHNPSGEDPVVYRGDRAVDSHGKVNPLLVSSAGITLNPIAGTFGRLGGVVPYVVVLVAFVFPLLCVVSEAPAGAQRLWPLASDGLVSERCSSGTCVARWKATAHRPRCAPLRWRSDAATDDTISYLATDVL
jgi:hypothetical protein